MHQAKMIALVCINQDTIRYIYCFYFILRVITVHPDDNDAYPIIPCPVMVSFAATESAMYGNTFINHSTKKPVTTMLTYPWKCPVLHCNHLGNTWKPLVLMTRHFDYCPSASQGDNQSVRSSAPVVSRCFPGGYNVKLYISRGRLAWWLLAFLHSESYKN